MRDIDQYGEWTESTAVYPEATGLQYLITGLTGEVGEFNSVMAKKYRRDHDNADFTENVKKELGDIAWFWAQLCRAFGHNPSEVLAANVAKLEDRKARGVLKGSGDNR